MRGPRVRHVRIAALDAAAQTPTMTIERWTRALFGPADRPWQVVDAAGGGVPA